VHVLLVLIDNLDLFLVLRNQISESQLQNRLSVDILSFDSLVLVLFSFILSASPVEAMLDHVDLMFVKFH
jgi:hypothetical protein